MRARMTILVLAVLFGSSVARAEAEFEEFKRISSEILWRSARIADNLAPHGTPIVPASVPERKTNGTDAELCADLHVVEVILRRKQELLAKKVLSHKEQWVAEFAEMVTAMQEINISMLRSVNPKRVAQCGA